MASAASERDTEEVFKPTTPHFFKILLYLDKLVIPRKFVRKYGDDMLDLVTLKVPSGNEWEVELFMSGGDVCLGNGWQEFVEHFSLVHGNMLVFEYTGSSCFNVLIFDTSATEIDYRILANSSPKTNPDGRSGDNEEKNIDDDDDSAIILDDSDTSSHPKRKRAADGSEIVRPLKVQPSVSVNGSKFDGMNPNSSRTFTGNREVSSRKRMLNEVAERTWSLTGEEKDRALQIAKASFKFKSPYFMVVMQPSYTHKSILSLPLKFMNKHFQQKIGQVVLQVLGGGSWVVHYRIDRRASFKCNWGTFARENHLKVRDVCIFELSNGAEPGFKVTIIRTSKDTIYNATPVSAHGTGTNSVGSPGGSRSKDKNQKSKAKVIASRKRTDSVSCSKSQGGVGAVSDYTLRTSSLRSSFHSFGSSALTQRASHP